VARALQIGIALYFESLRLALWRGGRRVRNGFVDLFFFSGSGERKNGIAAGAP
jgi:hypothetical protein